jgi:molecular chaperone GrpE (heat shock protein)
MQEKSLADTEKNTKAHQSEGSVLEENPSEKKDDSSTAEGKASQNVLVEEMEARIQALEEEKKQAYDGFLRTSAEFENYKKRKDQGTVTDYR